MMRSRTPTSVSSGEPKKLIEIGFPSTVTDHVGG